MFLSFFYLLRAHGLKVSLNEWLTLLQALQMGLHQNSLSAFYTLCRAIVISSETDFDRFDQVFLEFFQEMASQDPIPEEMKAWLEDPETFRVDLDRLAKATGLSVEEIERMFAKRLADQDAEHNGGRKWIGTDGYTAYGNRGRKMGGIRLGGDSVWQSAYRIAGERRYRDWRGDNTLDSRQFQAAFRSLCQVSKDTDQRKTELDVDATVQETCRQGGRLKMEYTQPRKNMIKLLLLIDSGGSMDRYQKLCSLLFQSINKAGHFKDLKIYYFHNCVGNVLYEEPTLDYRKTVPTSWVLKNVSSEYRVIFVGDGEMSPDELISVKRWHSQFADAKSPMGWLKEFKKQYPHIIWLHPQARPTGGSYWTQTFELLEEQFDMYRLSLDSLTQGMKKLMQNR